ncbi:hypothetical protein HRbin32_01866 [bacterium HR32]|nr:hypothetical protein HRbin32_01866 [bacterium HR32]
MAGACWWWTRSRWAPARRPPAGRRWRWSGPWGRSGAYNRSTATWWCTHRGRSTSGRSARSPSARSTTGASARPCGSGRRRSSGWPRSRGTRTAWCTPPQARCGPRWWWTARVGGRIWRAPQAFRARGPRGSDSRRKSRSASSRGCTSTSGPRRRKTATRGRSPAGRPCGSESSRTAVARGCGSPWTGSWRGSGCGRADTTAGSWAWVWREAGGGICSWWETAQDSACPSPARGSAARCTRAGWWPPS